MTEQKMQMEIYEKRIGDLQWNFEDLNKALDNKLAVYRALVYSADQINEAKKDRAALNSLKKTINDRRLELKKEFCEPYDKFAEQVKQLTTKIDTASGSIDSQIKAYEQQEKDYKRKRITEWWEVNGAKLYHVPIESVWNDKFLNKGCSDSAWQKELTLRAEQIDRDLDAISHIPDTDKLNFCVPEYLKRLDLGATLAAWEEKLEADRKAAELKERMERERAEREAQRQAEQARKAEERAQQVQNEAVQAYDEPFPEYITVDMRVRGTREQIVALGEFMKTNGIAFRRLNR